MNVILTDISAELQQNSATQIRQNEISIDNENLFEYFPEEYREKASSLLISRSETKNDLHKKLFSLGFSSFEDALKQEIDISNQTKASELIALQQEIKDFLRKEKEFLEIAGAVFIEPAKIHKTVDISERILTEHDCKIYQRGGRLVRILKQCHLPKPKKSKSQEQESIRRSPDAQIIRELDSTYLTELLNRLKLWIKQDNRSSDGMKKLDCPERIARHLLARGEWDLFPVLVGVINHPTLRPDGSILDIPGYDEETGLLFAPDHDDFAKIPQYPTRDDARVSLDIILDVLRDFPFDESDEDGDYTNTHRSVALSAILTGLIRKSISTAPLHGFSAPKMASGKSLLADIVAIIGSGNDCTMLSHADNEVEEKKRLMAVLLEADPFVCFDNIERPFGSSALCTVLTQQKYKDRILGETRNTEALTNICFLATGNNLTFIGDLSTRTMMCKLDPKVERPEEREFDVDLRKYARQNRGKLVQAGLTILRAYHVAGCPKQEIKQF
ncbi:MAG: hypothetical protein JSR46_06280, partial [Verrucomicrobia bacterium]|nr:hypothetical protein [Verrucomicrobiota bacterium]